MTKLKVKAVGMMILLLVLLTLTSCSEVSQDSDGKNTQVNTELTAEEEKVTLVMSFFGGAMDKEGYEYFVRGIEEVYPEIEVDFIFYTKDEDYYNYLKTAASSNTLPDILMMTDENVEEYIINGVLEPLDSIAGENDVDLTRFNPMLLEGWTEDGQLYGIPKDLGTSMIAYNQAMLEAHGIDTLPETMEELKGLAAELTTDDVYGICMNIHEFHITQYIHAFGGGWNNGRTINSAENIRGIRYMVDMFRDGYACTPHQVAMDWDGPVIGSEMAAISTGGSWYPGFISESAPDMTLVYAPVPMGTVAVQTIHSGGYAIAGTSEHKDEAMKVLDYMTRDEAMVYTATQLQRIPSTLDGLDTFIEEVDDEGFRRVLEGINTYGQTFNYPPHKSAFTEDLLSGLERIIFLDEGQTVEMLLDELQATYGTDE